MDVEVVPTNRILNQLDPCKDLAEGPTTADHAPRIIPMLKDLFVPDGGPWPWGETGVADTKGLIKTNLPGDYTRWIADKVNSMQILRAKHTTGHSQRPEGLFVSQDSGSPDVVNNPQLVVTPGTIIDPAGKTKKNARFVVAEYPTLSLSKIQSLGLDTSINGDITMTFTPSRAGASMPEGTFTMTIPTRSLGTIRGNFDGRTFKATDDSTYFMGNPVKNAYIRDYIDGRAGKTLEDCKKYLLCKELGDTLQVQWLNVLFDAAGSPYTRTNTVIITCDTVVFWRSVVNGVGVIFTVNGKTNYYNSRQVDEFQKRTMEVQFIQTIRNEVMKHNLSVLAVLDQVIREERVAATGKWLNGLNWSVSRYTNCVAYLNSLKTNLTNMNKDIDLFFDVITNVDAAKALAARSHFQNAFVWKQGEGIFKVNNKVKYLVGTSTYQLKALIPSNFDAAISADQSGGRRIQRGGVQTRHQLQEKRRQFKSLAETPGTNWDTVITQIYNDRALDKDGQEVLGAFALPTARPAPIVGNVDRYDLLIWSENLGAHKDDLNSTPYFLYVYVRDYHPEIFSYGSQVDIAINGRTATLTEEFLDYNIQYRIREDDKFLITVGAGVPGHDDLRDKTLYAMALTMKFVDMFPALQTENLMDFLAFFRGASSLASALRPFEIGANTLAQMGGSLQVNEENKTDLLDHAIDNYEVWYAYKLKALYEDRELTKKEISLIYGTASSPSPRQKRLIETIERTPMNSSLLNMSAYGGKRFKKTKKRKLMRKKRHTRRSGKRNQKK